MSPLLNIILFLGQNYDEVMEQLCFYAQLLPERQELSCTGFGFSREKGKHEGEAYLIVVKGQHHVLSPKRLSAHVNDLPAHPVSRGKVVRLREAIWCQLCCC